MKKSSLLKAMLAVFVGYIILSWIIPVGYFSDGEFISTSTTPIGVFDIILYPLIAGTSSVFILTAIVILFIGGLYGVLNKTGAYSKLLEGLAKKFKGKEKIVLIITTLLFTILSSLTGLTLPLFIFVSLFATLLMLLGYNKITAMVSTIGGILVGNMASTYGFNVAGYVSYLTEDINNSILFKILLLILFTYLLIFTVLKLSKSKKIKEEIPLYEKNIDKKAKCTSIVLIIIITFIVLFVGMFNWKGVFGIELFDNIHEILTTFEIGGYAILGKLIGTVPAIGLWTNYEICLLLILSSIIIGRSYKLSFSEILESFIDGMKKMLPVALWTVAANVMFLLMNSDSNGYTFYNTIVNFVLNLTSELNVITLSLVSLIGGILYNDFPYMLSTLYAPITNLSENYSLIGMVTQSIHGLVQLIAPTSVILVAGLTYFKIPYTEWLKKIWKLLLGLLIAFIITIIIFNFMA